MDIIFLGSTGVHHALLAANMYLGRVNELSDLRYIKGLYDYSKDVSGFPIYIGKDIEGNRVYTLGGGKEIWLTKKSIEQLLNMFGYSEHDLMVRTVNLIGDKIIHSLNKIPGLLGRHYLNMYLSGFIVKRNFAKLKQETEEFKSRLN